MTGDWKRQMRKRVRTLSQPSGKALLKRLEAEKVLPFAATAYWLSLACEDYETCSRDERGVPLDPILAQALPSPAEFERGRMETEDPLGEKEHSVLPRVVHQYPSRVLVRASGDCPLYCRYCFRRSLLPGEEGFIDDSGIEALGRYLEAHREVREVLVSGGEPLTASDSRRESLFSRIRAAGKDLTIRVCTRAPVSLPDRVDAQLVALFRRYRPLKVIIHVNHPAELSPRFEKAAETILDAGLPLLSQTVLLRGINDSTEVLIRLFSRLARLGIDPYYLFQGDLAAGTAHFRVPLSRSLEIYRELRLALSGLELPRLAVDAPDGEGKLFLPESIVVREGDFWILEGPDGRRHRYPEES
ncbi:MAG: KamA family radical SAM protein [Spirochaetes bacterium]|nr:KamA family radical SAM protein [Spirochaetota bacterium]